jgi:hypothetical protein
MLVRTPDTTVMQVVTQCATGRHHPEHAAWRRLVVDLVKLVRDNGQVVGFLVLGDQLGFTN